MWDVGVIQELLAGCIYLAAGLRLYLVSRRTQRFPERILGLSFVLWSGNYLLYDIPYLVLDESLTAPFYFAARLALDLGMFLFLLFTWKVFRSHDRWGAWLVAGITACILAGIGGCVWIGDWEGFLLLSNPWFWPGWLSATLAPAWMAAEGFHHHWRSRQRHRVGLCDAMTCDRFLLWGIAGAIWFALQFLVLYQYYQYELTQVWGSAIGAVVGLFEIVPVVISWVVFFPPAAYRAWIERRYASS